MESCQQDQEQKSIVIAHYPIMANTELVPSNPETSNRHIINIQQQVSSITRSNKDVSLAPKLQLVAFPLSNNAYKIKDYHKQQKTFSSPPEAIQQKMVEFVVRENCYALIPNRW